MNNEEPMQASMTDDILEESCPSLNPGFCPEIIDILVSRGYQLTEANDSYEASVFARQHNLDEHELALA